MNTYQVKVWEVSSDTPIVFKCEADNVSAIVKKYMLDANDISTYTINKVNGKH